MNGKPTSRAPAFAAELEATFLEELGERLRSMEAALIEIERPADHSTLRVALEDFSRDAHSLKGGAQLVGRDGLARIAHALESHLERIRLAPTDAPVAVDPLFAAVDVLDQLRRSGDASGVDVAGLVARLNGEVLPGSPGRKTAVRRALRAAAGPNVVAASTALPPVGGPNGSTTAAEGSAGGTGSAGPAAALPGSAMNSASPPGRPPALRAAPVARTDRIAGQARTVRVSTERLDALMNRTADLIDARNAASHRAVELRETIRRLDRQGSTSRAFVGRVGATLVGESPARGGAVDGAASVAVAVAERAELANHLRNAAVEARVESQRLAVLIEALETDLLALRMVPMDTLFREFPRMVRDLARASGKDVRLDGMGWDTPMDRDLLERLRDPVMHLLRNAVDHGIEAPEVRLARGKPPGGTIILEARPRAGGIAVEVRDDGGGIDLAQVHDRAAAAGLVDHRAPRSAALTLGLIFEPGLSTAPNVTEVSGRGIGLDVVRAQVAAAGGSVEVSSEPDLGTRFILQLPLTLVSTTVVIVRAGNRRYAVPLASVERVVPVKPGDLTSLGDRVALDVPGGSVVLSNLAAMVGAPDASSSPRRSEPTAPQIAIIMVSATGRAGIIVDAVESERDVVLKGFGPVLGTPALLAGAALTDGSGLLLVLDADALVERTLEGLAGGAQGLVEMSSPLDEPSRREDVDRPVRILVVDDSITTRTLEKNILAAAGFEVTVAVDGLEALRRIRANRPDVVVTDVAMPGLDGIGLTRRLRAHESTRDLPIILVTSLDAPEQREQGLAAGADAYLTKQTFDQQHLLRAIRELVG